MTRKKTHKQISGIHPVPGQSRKFVYVYVFFFSLILAILDRLWPILVKNGGNRLKISSSGRSSSVCLAEWRTGSVAGSQVTEVVSQTNFYVCNLLPSDGSGRLVFLPLLVLMRWGAAPVRASTGSNQCS